MILDNGIWWLYLLSRALKHAYSLFTSCDMGLPKANDHVIAVVIQHSLTVKVTACQPLPASADPSLYYICGWVITWCVIMMWDKRYFPFREPIP